MNWSIDKVNCTKYFNMFLNHVNLLEDTLMLKLIYLTSNRIWFKKKKGIESSHSALKLNLAKLKSKLDKKRYRQIKDCSCWLKQTKQCGK